MLLAGLNRKLFCAFFILAGPALAETVSVDATGMALNDPKNPLETRRIALVEAEKAAVEMSVGTWIEAHSTVSKAILEKSVIEAGTEGRVLSYRILSESPKGEFYLARIRALVDLQGRRFPDQNTVREALANLDSNKLYGVLTLVNGDRPTDEQLREAIGNPIPAVSAYVQKVASQTPSIDRIILLTGIAKSLGLPHSGQDIFQLENILERKP